MNFKQLMKNRKGISPIFATLILIAIAVIAGVVVYMFVSGTLATMMGGGTAAQEKITVQTAQYDSTALSISVYASTTTTQLPVPSGLIVKDGQGNTIEAVATTSTFTATGSLTTISGTLASALAPGSYTVTLTTEAGGSFVSPSISVS
jgi:archaeal type IV pilus assembly protein PilA